ncbi:MAG: sporulation transcriptional regulator SpoIIID [Clostridia bacterium]|nr:sporulation transcriptional regulator SpoIIID [Clostridia bacterium]
MYNDIEERVKKVAAYMIETGSTVRQVAKVFNISKSTIHKDISQRLEEINPMLAQEARKVLDKNKEERHIRGGMATKLKYEAKK